MKKFKFTCNNSFEWVELHVCGQSEEEGREKIEAYFDTEESKEYMRKSMDAATELGISGDEGDFVYEVSEVEEIGKDIFEGVRLVSSGGCG